MPIPVGSGRINRSRLQEVQPRISARCLSTAHVRSNYSLDLHLVRAPGGRAYHRVGYARKLNADAAKKCAGSFESSSIYIRSPVKSVRLAQRLLNEFEGRGSA